MALHLENGTQLCLIQGSIGDAKTDVIVNAVGRELNFSSSAVSKVLLQQAGCTTSGWTLESACRDKCPSGIGIGNVIDTPSGELCCKKVYHCSPRSWEDAKEQCVVELRQLVKTCLEKAHNETMTSISFPAISTGAAGVPRDMVANLMFEQVDAFCKEHKQTTLKTINIVLYHGDKDTIKVFRKYMEHMHLKIKSVLAPPCDTTSPVDVEHCDAGQADADTTAQNSGETVEECSGRDSVMTNIAEAASCEPTHYGRVLDIENINVQVKQGDLAKETSDAIVNTTTINFSVGGAVSEAIFKAGGHVLKEECDHLKQIKNEVAVTRAGSLSCQYVIHVAAPKKQDDWYNLIKKTLKLAEKHKLTSISFPALGTGVMGISPAAMGDIMVRAISSHARKHNKTLQTIYICVYMKEMMLTFEHALDKAHTKNIRPLQPAKQTVGSPVTSETMTDPQRGIRSEGVVRPKIQPSIYAGDYTLEDIAQMVATKLDTLPAGPSHWTIMDPNDIVAVVKLTPSSDEYKKVATSVLNDIKSCSIKEIQRIQNPRSHTLYTTLKKSMKNPNERLLWHGTSKDAVDSINLRGFDRQLHGKNGTVYGKGTYFAKSADYSKSYTKEDSRKCRCLYQCKVLTGEHTKGDKDLISLPAKNPTDAVEKQVLYDSLVDNVNDPKIFVIFHDNQAYPEYLVTFKVK